MNYLKNLTKKKEPAPQETPLISTKPTGNRGNAKDVEMNSKSCEVLLLTSFSRDPATCSTTTRIFRKNES